MIPLDISGVILSPMAAMRRDIQALRGWAVGLVLLDHFKIGPFSGGYLGVDIFFVVSGFLITGIITRGIEAGTFSFRDFYYRRAKRILPASMVVVAGCIGAAPLLLGANEMKDFTYQVIGAVTFSINFILLEQSDYFSNSAGMKPLLHYWSLAVEEQYYVFFPLILWLSPARWWPAVIGIILVISGVYCAFLMSVSPATAFYMLPSRAWELCIGSAGALMATRVSWLGQPMKVLFLPALATLIAIPVFPTGFRHPGIDAGLVCLATLIVVLSNNVRFDAIMKYTGLPKLGDISYSVYLIHWPLIAFANNAFVGGELPEWFRLAGALVAVVLAAILYITIENPIRKASPPKLPYATGVALAAAGLVGAQTATASTRADLSYSRLPNIGLSDKCDGSWPYRETSCANPKADTLLWGDSFAMHLALGLKAIDFNLVQTTFSACPPIRNFAMLRPDMSDSEKWATRCMDFNDAVIGFPGSIRTVIMSSPFRGFGKGEVYRRVGPGQPLSVVPSTLDDTIAALRGEVENVTKSGRQVIVIGPPPALPGGEDMGLCLERQTLGLVIAGETKGCVIDRSLAEHSDQTALSIINSVRDIPDVKVINLYDAMCEQSKCLTEIDGVPLYRDGGHLSREGTVKVFKRVRKLGLL